jgi:hypothetical protein
MTVAAVATPRKPPSRLTVAERKTLGQELADLLGEIKADIAPLTETEKEYKDQIKKLAPNAEYDGEKYRATVSTFDVEQLIKKKIEALLVPTLTPKQLKLYNACFETAEQCKVTVKARIRAD